MDIQGNGANTVKHHHANIRKALQRAYLNGLIPFNPADRVELPRCEKMIVNNFYDADEMKELFAVCQEHRLGLLILLAAYYGLRRSEVLGLKWQAINFKTKTITISHVVTDAVNADGVLCQQGTDRTKVAASRRTLPLLPEIEKLLVKHRKQLAQQRRVFNGNYCEDFLEYIFLDETGKIIKPNTVTQSFNSLLKSNNLRHIRFHDLRHSCASLLLANGIDLKRIQEWLGHASMDTTARFYAHLSYESKLEAANVLSNALSI